jgi:hypothetical protein
MTERSPLSALSSIQYRPRTRDRKANLNFGDHLFTEKRGARRGTLSGARGAQAATPAGERQQVLSAADATPHPGGPAIKDAAVEVSTGGLIREGPP